MNYFDGWFDGFDLVIRVCGYGMEWVFSKMDWMCIVLDYLGIFVLCEVYKSLVCVYCEL